jgi:hypothetical protein
MCGVLRNPPCLRDTPDPPSPQSYRVEDLQGPCIHRRWRTALSDLGDLMFIFHLWIFLRPTPKTQSTLLNSTCTTFRTGFVPWAPRAPQAENRQKSYGAGFIFLSSLRSAQGLYDFMLFLRDAWCALAGGSDSIAPLAARSVARPRGGEGALYGALYSAELHKPRQL